MRRPGSRLSWCLHGDTTENKMNDWLEAKIVLFEWMSAADG